MLVKSRNEKEGGRRVRKDEYLHYSTSWLLNILLTFLHEEFLTITDESAVCDWELLHTFVQSTRRTSAHHLIVHQNPEQLSILPGITINGVLAVTQFIFLILSGMHLIVKILLQLPCMNRYPGVNSILVCNKVQIHRPRVQALCNEAGVLLIYLPRDCVEFWC
ncbi:hypothetical protein VP01_1649g5 [Puccinia sorghi]|uniref:Uncharacterized protein n=1 Tax=Puccinia sorghi TaxID=27349 RepID=A0A0L6VH67_9BASI|nr:hypothetical protein VP01_1649g5 [Puccinia sorghi]